VTDVNINIEAMRAMLNGLHKARTNVDDLKTKLDALLNKATTDHGGRLVEASTGRLGYVLFWIDDSIPDINRRLALAEDVASATPSFRPGDTVWIDDDRITGLSVGQAAARGREIAQRLTDQQMTDQDWEDLISLSADPYFAVALANHCPPETLAQTALSLSGQYQTRLQYQGDEYAAYQAMGGDQALTDWAAGQADAYQQRLASLGTVLGAATRTGQLYQGYADQVVAVLHQQGPLPAAMGAVLGYGVYSTGFAYTIAADVYDYERGGDFSGTWSQGVAGGTYFTLPDGTSLTDPMPGVMAMLSTSPEAAQRFFTQGGSTTVTINGQQFEVNSRLQYLIAERIWAVGHGSDEGDGLGRALEVATTVPGGQDFSQTSAAILNEMLATIQERSARKDGWDIGDILGSNHQKWCPYVGLQDHIDAIRLAWQPDFSAGSVDGFHLGLPQRPDFTWDEGFEWGTASPTADDYASRLRWEAQLYGARTLRADLDDATQMYAHYWDNDGKPLAFDYEEAYLEDDNIRAAVDAELGRVRTAADDLAQDGFPVFPITGDPHAAKPYPSTENWQKTIGDHQMWSSADVSVVGQTVTMTVTVHAEDHYNFNPGQQDIASGAPDNDNGRFTELGWAKPFDTHGELTRTITWTLGEGSESSATTDSGSPEFNAGREDRSDGGGRGSADARPAGGRDTGRVNG
jgi:hypothetical protein